VDIKMDVMFAGSEIWRHTQEIAPEIEKNGK
jgi:hypothetical protein